MIVSFHTNAKGFTPFEISSTGLYDGTLYFTLYLTLSHLAVKSRAHREQWEVDWHIPTLLRVGSPFILSHYTQRPCGSLHTYTWTKGVFSPNTFSLIGESATKGRTMSKDDSCWRVINYSVEIYIWNSWEINLMKSPNTSLCCLLIFNSNLHVAVNEWLLNNTFNRTNGVLWKEKLAQQWNTSEFNTDIITGNWPEKVFPVLAHHANISQAV